ncbi:MAG: FAD-dependent oxidoreductase, partial [candidate division WOR-3 bacterium]
MNEIKTELAIIGAGPGGYVAGIRAGQLGIKTVIIEKQYVGGVCLNVGCIPTKALLFASEIFLHSKTFNKMGINFSDVSIDLNKLNSWKNSIVDKLVSGVNFLLKNYKVEIIFGEATFLDEKNLIVKTKNGDIKINAKNIIIATGSRPADLGNIKVDHKFIWDSNDAVEMREIPKKLLIIGAGAIGLEFG